MGTSFYGPEIEGPIDIGAIDLDRGAEQSRHVLKGAPEALFPILPGVGGYRTSTPPAPSNPQSYYR